MILNISKRSYKIKINNFMNRIKFFGVFAIAGLLALSAAQFHRVSAEQENNGSSSAISSQASGSSSGESESESGSLNSSALGNSQGSRNEGEGSQNGGTPSLSVNPANKIVINGASLVSNSGQSMSIKIFGFNLNLAITPSTVVAGVTQASASSTSPVSDMKTGDIIDVTGQIDSASGIVTVSQIRDETMRQQNDQNIQQQIQVLLEQLRKLQAQLNTQSGGQ